MMVSVASTGLAALRRRLAALPQVARVEGATAMDRIGAGLVAEARRMLASGGPAEPGSPPDDPAGNLADSLGWSLDPDGPRLVVTAASTHARFLEYGTRAMAARPFLRPAIAASEEHIRAEMRGAMARAAATLSGDAS